MGEEGRGDDRQIFGDECLVALASILGIKDEVRLAAFRDDLRTFGIERRTAIRAIPIAYPIAPFDASLSRRIEWLDTHVINPTEKLLSALEPGKRPYFSDWPEEFANRSNVDLESVSSQLKGLQVHISELRASLAAQRNQGISHLSEMRYDIVFNLVEILHVHFPELKLSRGQFDKELGVTIGVIPDFIRAAYVEITGASEQLDAPIQSTLDAVRKIQRKPS